MKSTRIACSFYSALLLGVMGAPIFAAPDPALWNVVNNPNGMRIVPDVVYNPATGMVSVDTRGLDGVVSTVGNGTIAGDDVGLISFILTGPDGVAQAPFTGLDLTQFISWSNSYFNGKEQIVGTALTPANQFLVPGVYPIVQYAPNLPLSTFGAVEIGVNFTSGTSGSILFGRVQAVPEPGTCSLISALGLAGIAAFRRRR